MSGGRCFYSGLTHRLRYKSFTSDELTKELVGSEKAFEEFKGTEQLIINQKKRGLLQIDLASIPIPTHVVEKSKKSKLTVKLPARNIVTEAAFRKRSDGMSFKEAGVVAQEFEVED